jgi:hypothetical protein
MKGPWQLVLLTLCIVGLRVVSGAQPSATPPQISTVPVRDVSGMVVNSVTNEPIARALVQAPGSAMAVLTDSEGRFHFEKLPAYQSTFVARKPGYFSEQELGGMFFQQVTSPEEQKAPVLKLIPQAVIAGKITGVNDEPPPRIQLRAIQIVIRDGMRITEDAGAAASKEDGGFRIGRLRPGRYYVCSTPAVLSMDERKQLQGVGATCYPGVPEMTSATAVTVAAGQQVPIEFPVATEPLYRAAVSVSGMPEGRQPWIQWLSPSGMPVNVNQRMGAAGLAGPMMFEGLPRGSYRVVAAYQDEKTGALGAEEKVEVASDIDNIQLAMSPLPSIPIEQKLIDSGQNSEGMVAPQNKEVFFGNLQLTPVDQQLQSYSMEPQGPKSTRWMLRAVRPGRYRVQATTNGEWYVESLQCGSTDLLQEDLEVVRGRVDPIEMTLRNDGGSVEMRVETPGREPASAVVLVVPEQGRRPITVNILQAGSPLSVSELAPGPYLIYAFDTVEGLEYRNRERMREYESRASRVTVGVNSRSEVVLQLIRRTAP